jgi:hypothetical protein
MNTLRPVSGTSLEGAAGLAGGEDSGRDAEVMKHPKIKISPNNLVTLLKVYQMSSDFWKK